MNAEKRASEIIGFFYKYTVPVHEQNGSKTHCFKVTQCAIYHVKNIISSIYEAYHPITPSNETILYWRNVLSLIEKNDHKPSL